MGSCEDAETGAVANVVTDSGCDAVVEKGTCVSSVTDKVVKSNGGVSAVGWDRDRNDIEEGKVASFEPECDVGSRCCQRKRSRLGCQF